ncbi:MAG TPA: glycosyltransferase, partial [Dehalococcoidia bacterium]|nr:glycosyltransferase [Dehalococcoidia bacterium]
MLDLIFVPLLLIYFSIVTALFTYGANFLHLTLIALRSRSATPPSVVPEEWPTVTVQLPIYNEMYVARRLIDAAAMLDYPTSRLQIQVLDDSTDETVAVVEQAVEHWRAEGVDIRHVRRPSREGFKAGALGNGLEQTDSEYLALFDADFIPRPDFLKRTCPVLYADPGLAFVQARWGHTNRMHSPLTLLQSLSIDGHFAIEQYARWRAGYFFNFNGTAGVWRRDALFDAGGWHGDTLTEDLDISYRAFLRGWRAAFVRDVEAPAELPASFDAYRRQQHRWARGSLECAMKHIPTIWKSALPAWRKAEATLHLTGYAIHLLMLALAFLYPLLLAVSAQYPSLLSLFGFMAVFNLAGLVPAVLFTAAQQQLGQRWPRMIPVVLLLSLLGAGMMLTTARAAWQAFSKRPGAFERTPKFGLGAKKREWMRLRYQPPVDKIIILEYAVGGLNFYTSYTALSQGVWTVGLYTAIFGLGLWLTASWTVAQALGRTLKRRSVDPSSVVAPAVGVAAG